MLSSSTTQFLPASSFTLDQLADLFTRSFEDYFYAMRATSEDLARRVRVEQLDLQRSLIMQVDDDPAGIALLGIRGDQAWCGGFGITVPYRGRKLAHGLATAMLEQARQAGARLLSLEVLTRNERAIKTYAGMGLTIRRDLLILDWRRMEGQVLGNGDEAMERSCVVADEPRSLLQQFAALHPVPAAWQRDLPALLVRGALQGLALLRDQRPVAYVLFNGAAHIADLAAEQPADVAVLLRALQARYESLFSVNEPADSPLTGALLDAGFTEVDRQYEMAIEL